MEIKPRVDNSNHEHALLSPSAAKKWALCPAALACEFGIPNTSGQAAVNGTSMHSLSEKVLLRLIKGDTATVQSYKGSYVLNDGKGPVRALTDKPPAGAVMVTDDFVSQVSKYVDYCRPIIDAAEVVEIEQRVNLTRVLHPGTELSGKPLATFGTADLVAVMPASNGSYMLIVGDLKTGRHRVEAKENYQMMLYALGLLQVYKRLYDITSVRLVIFQPYAGGADEWDTTPEALQEFGTFASKAALKAIDAFQRGKKGLKPADFNPGAEQCRWCRFSEKCSAKRGAVFQEKPTATEVTLDQLKADWDRLPLLRQQIADIEKAMYTALMRGEKVEGLKLVEGREGNRAWTDADKVRELFGDRVLREVVMTPTEALKVIPAAELDEYITRKPGQPSIATADDKRPEWSPVSDDDLSN